MKILFVFTLLFSVLIPSAMSRPVSYPGGWTAILMNNGDAHSALFHYSPSAKYSIGLRSEYRRDGEYSLTSLQMNNLLKRWNRKNSQANLYLQSGVGVAVSNTSVSGDQTEPAFFTGMAFDWETRRYFLSYENRYIEASDIDDFYMQNIRLGIAPYIAGFGSLHTWLMLEVEHDPEDEDTFTVTPILRLFKGVHLAEAGISSDNDLVFNWTIRF